MTYDITKEPGDALVQVPSGEELFTDDETFVIEPAADRYLRKPKGNSDQGYRED